MCVMVSLKLYYLNSQRLKPNISMTTYLKGSKSQWCAKYDIEYPSTQSASNFLIPAMKYTINICQVEQKQFRSDVLIKWFK